ncbi:NAD(P)/FAD-dependent oxidoreductase [Enteractinococcus fodinae]|uniref:Thioredoxin reductase n=1 Tax=Enteractinococcus fodinae TaxID=684663 RepID=A0ABU2B047_9MICC|nr:NAD(P)/FAD-dependent oxidoreductase [Enteractinococcus fodinae]MDR7346979.1 thioredoxin reductase [Enteractinococcus fodinae]
MTTTNSQPVRDVIIIGGGAAGLNAALVLARARRSVTVVDARQPRNAPSAAAHGMLGNEGINPLELLDRGRAEAQSYGAEILTATVDAARPDGQGYLVRLHDGRELQAAQLVVATGVRDVLPDIEGLSARWGKDVIHCPYCHGWEIRDQTIGIIATSATSAYQAMLFQQWSQNITLFSNGYEFEAEALDTLAALNIPVIDTPVAAVEITDDAVTGLRLTDGRTFSLQVVGVSSGKRVNLDGLEALGLETYDNPEGTFLRADDTGHTNVAGVWAAGNVMDPEIQISECASQGARVAVTINNELVFSRADAALAAARQAT